MSNRLSGEGDPTLEEKPDRSAAPASTNEELHALPARARRRRDRRAPSVEKEWYSKTEAARYLGVAEITVTRYLERGILQAQRLPTAGTAPRSTAHNYGRLRIHRSELDRYLKRADRGPAEGVVEGRIGIVLATNASVTTTPDDNSEVMTREEAALRLGVSWRTIKRYIESGKLRLAGYFRCPDSYTRAHVYRSDVEKLLPHAVP